MLELERRVASLERVVLEAMDTVLRMQGSRLTRAQLCKRIGKCDKTLGQMIRQRRIPPPTEDGSWLLADIMAWERSKSLGDR